jgi:anti-sigma factor RsiW
MNGKLGCKRIQRLIESYVDNAATTDERRAVETHVAECAPCAGSLETSRRLVSLLQGAPARKVDGAFETRLFAALEEQEPAPARAAWWERFRLQFEWRFRMPALVTASGLAAAAICGIIAPPLMQSGRIEAGKREVMAATLEQHRQLQDSGDLNPDDVDASIDMAAGQVVTR